MFPHVDILLEFWIEHVIFRLLFVMVTIPTRIFYRGGYRLCNWLSLWSLVPGIKHLPAVCCSTFFRNLVWNKTDVERRQTLGNPRSINPNMINHVAKQSPIIFCHMCCLYTKQYKFRIRIISMSRSKKLSKIRCQQPLGCLLPWLAPSAAGCVIFHLMDWWSRDCKHRATPFTEIYQWSIDRSEYYFALLYIVHHGYDPIFAVSAELPGRFSI